MTIGVDLGATQIRAGIYEGGKISNQINTLLKEESDLESSLNQLKQFIATLVNADTEGIGIGVPSVVDISTGTVYDAVNIPSWKKVPLKSILENEFSVPVHVNNDANCYTNGIYRSQFSNEFQNVVGITLGTGIGIGLILNGQPYYGQNCGAGELGLMPYLKKNYEAYCSSSFFIDHNTTAKKAHDHARNGDQKYLELWKEYGRHLGQFLKVVVSAYDPEVICFGGSISSALDLFNKDLNEALSDYTFQASIEKLKITQYFNEDVALLGAASLVKINQTLSL